MITISGIDPENIVIKSLSQLHNMNKTRKLIAYFAIPLLSLLSSNSLGQSVKKIHVGKDVTFSTSLSGNYVYKWHLDKNDGKGFVPLSNDNTYNNVNGKELTIRNADIALNNFRFTCKVFVITQKERFKPLKNKKSGKVTFIKISDLEMDPTNINEGKVDTLNVITRISRMPSIVQRGQQVELEADDAGAGYTFEWQSDEGFGFKALQGTDVNTRRHTVSNPEQINGARFRCVVHRGADTLSSNIETLIVTGCLRKYPSNACVRDKVHFAVSHPADSSLSYRWYVRPNNSGHEFKFIDLATNDSNVYACSKDTLTIRNAPASLIGSAYYCEIYMKNGAMISSQECTLDLSGKIGYYPDENRLSLMAAFYSGIQGVKDDNADNLTQIYLRTSIYRRTSPIDLHASSAERLIWFRNLFIQTTFSTNVESLKYFNIQDTTFTTQPIAKLRGINRLDLLKNATWNVNLMVPVITYFFPAYSRITTTDDGKTKKRKIGDMAHLYADPMASLLITTVNNKNLKDSLSPLHIYSLQYGVNVGLRYQDLKLNNLPLFFELQSKIFWISTLSNSINPNLNYQQSKVQSDYTGSTSQSLVAKYNCPYFNVDALIIYYLSNSSTSNVFLHGSFYTNIVNPVLGNVYNNYWQLQAGYALDINSFWSKLNPKKS